MKKLIKISTELNANGFEHLETEWDAEEKIKIYKLSRIDEDGDKIKRVLFKENLNEIRNEYASSIYMIRYTCVCEPDKV